MPLGPHNPLSFRVGGGPTRTQVAYRALRSAVGVGNAAAEEGTVIEAWRRARARGLAAAHGERRAVLEAISPDLATDQIPMYERILGKRFPLATPAETRRRELLALWVSEEDAVTVEEALQAIDASVTVEVTSPDEHRESQLGRGFEDHRPTSPQASGPAFALTVGYSGPKCDSYPNFSDAFRFYVRFPHAGGSFPAASQRKRERMKAQLNKLIPAWCDWVIFTHSAGYILDLDLLDVTAFGP